MASAVSLAIREAQAKESIAEGISGMKESLALMQKDVAELKAAVDRLTAIMPTPKATAKQIAAAMGKATQTLA